LQIPHFAPTKIKKMKFGLDFPPFSGLWSAGVRRVVAGFTQLRRTMRLAIAPR
jgi:hypothetical protein